MNSRSGLLFVPVLIMMACGHDRLIGPERSPLWAIKINSENFTNLYRVDDHLYRSEQPPKISVKELNTLGIGTVLDLRNFRSDKNIFKGSAIGMEHERVNAWTISYEEIVKAVKYITRCEKPVLVHCKHGSDRTGCVVAAYRMAVDGWSKDEAINEFLNGGFGYHKGWFPNMLKLLKKIDPEKLKTDVKN